MKRVNTQGGGKSVTGPKKSVNSPFSSDNEEPKKQEHPISGSNQLADAEEEKKIGQSALSSRSFLGKRKATHLPIKDDKSKRPPLPVQVPKINQPPEPVQKTVLRIGEQNSYHQQQEEHLKTVERERKNQQSKKQREQEQDEWAVSNKKGAKKVAEEVQDIEDDDSRYDEEDAIDMRREDAELEQLLREYNDENQFNGKSTQEMLDKPLDLPFYKGIQLPEHLKWVSIFSKQNETVLMQEIHALDLELKRLREMKVIHKEFRRYVEMPSIQIFKQSKFIVGVMSKPCPCCKNWAKKKHQCTHEFCEKPCKKHEESLVPQPIIHHHQSHNHHHQPSQPKPPKESIIQQQIQSGMQFLISKNTLVLLSTLQKIQQKQGIMGGSDQIQFDQSALHQQTLSYLNMIGANNPFQGGQMTGIIFPMVDERNKRGRPPKKPKPAEVEQKEKSILNQKIIEQLQQQQQALGIRNTSSDENQAETFAANVKIEQQEVKKQDINQNEQGQQNN